MNVNDSQWLCRALDRRGYEASDLATSSLILVNTCSVREKPEQKVRQYVERIFWETSKKRSVLVVILGCVAKQLGERCFSFSPQVRFVCGPDHIGEIPDRVAELLDEPEKKLVLTDDTARYPEREILGVEAPQSYVTIMQGCDKFCTYCIVPYTRGRERSRDPLAILQDCRAKLALGASEIVLLGQNVNAYGKDSPIPFTFAELLERVDALDGLQRLRYTSPHPKDMDARDIEAFGRLRTLCPSLHLPMQSGSSTVLRRMGRGYSRKDYEKLVAELKSNRPDLCLTTDIIVGFPGETEADLEETLSLMEACRFSASYSFCYSDRPGTKASTFTDKIPSSVQHERLLRVQELQDKLTDAYFTKRLGTETTVLIEHKSKRPHNGIASWEGRDPYGVRIHIPATDSQNWIGHLVSTTIVEKGKHCLFGSPSRT
ncbi:MAG: tRNA (N6-isopentenyl adenosine(37)-C2)-methylthiotransferase MiaB [Desulfovibrionaceae bacterium]|nr:tRNA (N6-isopentenyl adenosine(37)-C2)-methylthiotransferase MiaB [Desulfovibrionaceae bacterium]